MSLEQIYDLVTSKLPSGFPSFLGPEGLVENSAPPRVVWVPSVDVFASPEAPRLPPGAKAPKPLRKRLAGVDIFFWGEDYTQTENMLAEYMTVLVDEARSALTVVSGDWARQDEDTGWLVYGRAYRLAVQFDVPLVQTLTYGTLETIAQDCMGLTVSNTGD